MLLLQQHGSGCDDNDEKVVVVRQQLPVGMMEETFLVELKQNRTKMGSMDRSVRKCRRPVEKRLRGEKMQQQEVVVMILCWRDVVKMKRHLCSLW